MDKKKSILTILSISFASLSLILSLCFLGGLLVCTLGYPMSGLYGWIKWVMLPGIIFRIHLPITIIALFFIIVAFFAHEGKKSNLLIPLFMLIPGILGIIIMVLLARGFGRM